MPAFPRQLALNLALPERMSREDFLDGEANATALEMIESWPHWPAQAVVLVGPEASGKSHLASIWAELSGARFVSATALETSSLPLHLATGALVVEDIGPDDMDGRAMFHLLNLLRQDQAFALFTSRTPPAQWKLEPPDALSRLRALPVISLSPPDDRMLRQILIKLFSDRQIAPDPALVDFVANRIERSIHAARTTVDHLDREALRLRRPLTRTLAAQVLKDQGELFSG